MYLWILVVYPNLVNLFCIYGVYNRSFNDKDYDVIVSKLAYSLDKLQC